MARRPNTLPTTIYWLVDMRPETIANGWSNGYPFYCGKTIFSGQKRLTEHRHVAKTKPHLAIAAWIRGCGKHIRVQVMETVPVDKDWAERECWWIKTLRVLWPLCANITNGGQGVPGLIPSRESIERRMAKRRKKPKPKHTPESKALIGAASKGRKQSAESIERRVAKVRGRKHTKKTKAKIGKASKGRKRSAESIERQAAQTRGQKRTPEQIAKSIAGAIIGREKALAKKIAKRQRRAEIRARSDQRRQDRINAKLNSTITNLPEISFIC